MWQKHERFLSDREICGHVHDTSEPLHFNLLSSVEQIVINISGMINNVKVSLGPSHEHSVQVL